MKVTYLILDSSESLPQLRRKFKTCQPIPLMQDYAGGNPDASPTGEVRILPSGTSLSLYAELKDEDIHTKAKTINEQLWNLGDCFEMFLKLADKPQYLEFHIAPNNQVLQLLLPSSASAKPQPGISFEESLNSLTIKRKVFKSQVWCQPKRNRWITYAEIDLTLLDPNLRTLEGTTIQYSFCRYDYTRGVPKPTLSSSSTMARLDFHAQEYWRTLSFQVADNAPKKNRS